MPSLLSTTGAARAKAVATVISVPDICRQADLNSILVHCPENASNAFSTVALPCNWGLPGALGCQFAYAHYALCLAVNATNFTIVHVC